MVLRADLLHYAGLDYAYRAIPLPLLVCTLYYLGGFADGLRAVRLG